MKTTEQGILAEKAVADYLTGWGMKIIVRNWKTRVCEIDIVAQKDNIVNFVEVKYRSRDGQGDGLEYITPQKLKRLHFAAQVWAQQHNWDGDYRLLAASVTGEVDNLVIEQVVELE